jgi:hypothetical protein
MKVALKERKMFMHKEKGIWYPAGTVFTVLAIKEFHEMLGYMLLPNDWFNCIDGWYNADCFEVISDEEDL